MSLLESNKLPKQRLRLDGEKVTKEAIKNRILELLRIHKKLTPTELGQKISMDRSALQRNYLREMIDEDKTIKKVENSHYYTLADNKITKEEIKQELYNKTEIFNTEIFKAWGRKITSKEGEQRRRRIARLCLGKINKKFKMNPDTLTAQNWKDISTKMRDAFLEAQKKPAHPEGRLSTNDKQAIRLFVQFSLGIKIDKTDGEQLGIDGKTADPTVATLHIKKEQITELKQNLKQNHPKIWFVKAGIKLWSGIRPSITYTIPTNALEFYDRTVEYIEINGAKFTNEAILEFAKVLLIANPDLGEKIAIQSYTHRACTFDVLEYKQKKWYRKHIFDEEFVTELEKYWKQRKFEHKKYLFWDDNNTEFDRINYNRIVRDIVLADNSFFKARLQELGFTKSDFGKMFRANYGFRHFAIQIWLIATDYNYSKVAEMFHESEETLKKWYGRPVKEYAVKMFAGVTA